MACAKSNRVSLIDRGGVRESVTNSVWSFQRKPLVRGTEKHIGRFIQKAEGLPGIEIEAVKWTGLETKTEAALTLRFSYRRK